MFYFKLNDCVIFTELKYWAFNPVKPGFTIVFFIHYKPLIVFAILD